MSARRMRRRSLRSSRRTPRDTRVRFVHAQAAALFQRFSAARKLVALAPRLIYGRARRNAPEND